MIGVITNTEIRKNRDGLGNRIMLQVELNDGDDIQTVELMTVAGEDFHPPKGTKVFVTEVGAAYKIAIAGDDGIEPSTAEGEKKIYSLSSGAIAAIIHWMEDGQLVLNNGAGTAVEFARLKTAFDQLKSDFDKHTHAVNKLLPTAFLDSLGFPCAGVTDPPVAPTTADIDPAESPTVNLP
jgi:hypothetical protein